MGREELLQDWSAYVDSSSFSLKYVSKQIVKFLLDQCKKERVPFRICPWSVICLSVTWYFFVFSSVLNWKLKFFTIFQLAQQAESWSVEGKITFVPQWSTFREQLHLGQSKFILFYNLPCKSMKEKCLLANSSILTIRTSCSGLFRFIIIVNKPKTRGPNKRFWTSITGCQEDIRTKLGRLGIPKWIVDNLKSYSNKLEQ